MCTPKNIRQLFWALGCVIGIALLASAHHPPPAGDTPATFKVSTPKGKVGPFSKDEDVVFTVTHDCTEAEPLNFEKNIGRKPPDDYHDYYGHKITYTTPSGGTRFETQYSPLYWYAVVKMDPINFSASPVAIGSKCTASVTVTPADRTVIWSKVSETPDKGQSLVVDIDKDTGVITVGDTSGEGEIRVRAEDSEIPDKVYREADLRIECPPCGGTCTTAGDSTADQGGSLRVQFMLGRRETGGQIGRLHIAAHVPSADLATPAALALRQYGGSGLDVVTNWIGTNAVLRQVKAPETLADIVPLTPFKYEIRFYQPADAGAKDTNGVYVPTGAPFVSYAIENPAATTNDISTLRITQTRGSVPVVHEYVYAEAGGVGEWTLISGNGLRREAVSLVTNATEKIYTRSILNADGSPALKENFKYHKYDWGYEIVEKVNDPDGAALTTTKTYYDDTPHPGQYGKLASMVNADGSWRRYDYDSEGRTILEVSSWLDAASNAAPEAARALYKSYAPVDPLDDGTVYAQVPRLTEEKIMGITVFKTFTAHYYATNNPGERVEIEERSASPAAAYGAAENLRTTRIYYPIVPNEPDSGKIRSVTYPDGRMDSYSYEAGDYASGTFAASLTGAYQRVTTVHGTAGSPAGTANKTTQDVTVSDRFGRTVLQEQYVYTGSGYDLIAWTQYTLDDFGRESSRRSSNGEEVDSTWACCGKEYEKDAAGIERTFSYDALKRLVFSTKAGIAAGTYPAQEAITTTYTLDALGRQVQTVVSAGSLSQTASNAYDLAGRQTRSLNAAGLITATAYANNGLTVTETLPGGFTRITERYPDGQTKSVTGTAAPAQYYEYGINADGTRWTKVTTGAAGGPVWQKTTTDLLGRTAKVERPGFSTTEVTENFYNNKGQLVRQSTADGLQSLFAYDELGNQIRSGLDLNANGILDLAGADRITESETFYNLVSGIWYLESVSRIYATDNSATPTTNSVTRQRLTGLPVAGGGDPGMIAETITIDAFGNQTVSQTAVDRSNKKVTQTTDVPDSSSNIVTVAVNGLVQSQTSKSGITALYSYDSLSRRTTVTDPRLGITVAHYDSRGWADYTEDAAGNRTTFTYDPATGRRLSQTDPLSNLSYFAYSAFGSLERTWGSAVYPERYEYDQYNRKIKMATYRAGAGFDGPTWPASAGEGDVTTWTYHEASGLLTAKTDAAGKQVSYTYDSANRPATRTWSRFLVVGAVPPNGDPLVTSYSYSDSGDLSAIDYSDGTPDVSFTSDRLGRQKTASSSVSTHTFAYNGLLLDSETIVSSAGTNVLARSYDSLGRSIGFTVAGVADPGYSVAYNYDSFGRLNQISNFQFQASYSYLPNSDLIETLSTDNGLLITRSYEDHRNLLTQIENSLGTNVISSYSYANDALGRRVSAGWGGSAFDEIGPTVMKYAYNSRSEVVSAERFFGDDPAQPDAPVAGQNWDYAFDPIGNRQTAARDSDTEIYTANNLNQYMQRTVPGSAHVAGTADEDSTVTINRPSISGTTVEPVTRQGGYFHKKLLLDNSVHADAEEIEVLGVKAGAGTNGIDIVSAYTGFVWAAKSPEQFTYDADGNMLSDSLRKYEWDAENRLIAVTASNVVDGTLTRVEFAYDYMSRRVSKKVYSWSSSNFEFQISSIRYFLYDGWNLVREITTASGLGSITDDYIWGLDLSGSLQGAGGIGGLLARYRSVHRYYDEQGMLIICHRPPGNPENKTTIRINDSAWPAHEAHGDTLGACDGSSVSNSAFLYTFDGNGNVSEVIGTVNCETVNCELRTVGHYEYSPFGETITAVGPEAQDNPFRFSTKYFVDELGIGDWGRRWYIPPLGRWLSRDPVGEEGGENLYIFMKNTGVNFLQAVQAYLYPIITKIGEDLAHQTPRSLLIDEKYLVPDSPGGTVLCQGGQLVIKIDDEHYQPGCQNDCIRPCVEVHENVHKTHLGRYPYSEVCGGREGQAAIFPPGLSDPNLSRRRKVASELIAYPDELECLKGVKKAKECLCCQKEIDDRITTQEADLAKYQEEWNRSPGL